jgi:hypothetical protein
MAETWEPSIESFIANETRPKGAPFCYIISCGCSKEICSQSFEVNYGWQMSEKYFRGAYQIQVDLPQSAIVGDYNSPWESVAMLADMGIALRRVDMFLPSVIVWWVGKKLAGCFGAQGWANITSIKSHTSSKCIQLMCFLLGALLVGGCNVLTLIAESWHLGNETCLLISICLDGYGTNFLV